MATRHETNATKLSAGFQGPFRPLFTMAQTARLYCKIPHLWCFALDRKKERSKITQQCKLTSVCWLYFSARYIFVLVHDCVMQKWPFCVSKPWQEPCSFCCTDYVWEKIHVCQIMTYPDWGVWTTYHMEKKLRQHSQSKLSQNIHPQRIISILYIHFFFQIGTAQVAAYTKTSFVSFGFC